jgi:hypothetical protein
MKRTYWLVVQAVAIALGIAAGMWVYGVVSA